MRRQRKPKTSFFTAMYFDKSATKSLTPGREISKMDVKKAQHARRKCDEAACRLVRRSVVLGWDHIKESDRIPDEFSVDDLTSRHNPGV
jgi:hypothetical protein